MVSIEAAKAVREYVTKEDWRVNANANIDYSNAGLVNSLAGKVIANYWLEEVYTKEASKYHREGVFHIHDLDNLTGYCAGWSLRVMLDEGFNGVRGRAESTPPSHLREALGQMANFLGILQSEWAGAQAFSSFDTYLAPYVLKDNLSEKEVKKAIRSFVYNLNVPARWGQSPFTNITIDWTVPKDLAPQIPTRNQEHLLKGSTSTHVLKRVKKVGKSKVEELTYSDFLPEMRRIQKAFYEVMTEGDAIGQPFTFPIPTVNITEDFDWDGENTDILFENTAKVGSSYFQNFVGSQYIKNDKGELVENPKAYKPDAVRSMCPLTPDTKVLVKSDKSISKMSIDTLVKNLNNRSTKYKVWNGSSWVGCSPVRTEKTRVFKITLSNGDVVRMGENHLQPVKARGTLSAKDLEVGMYLPYNKGIITGNNYSGSSSLGYAVGAYLGDGSVDCNGINYSLDAASKDYYTERILTTFWEDLGYRVTVSVNESNCRSLRVGGNSFDVIKRFITGKYAVDKGMSKYIFDSSVAFRLGVVSGLIATDGSRSKRRYYTSSKTLANDILSLFGSLGEKALISSVDNRDNRLGDNPNYTISYPKRSSYEEVFKEDSDYNYYSIKDIQEDPYYGDSLYCLEVEGDSHLFMLASGLITHNCRLQLDLRELLKRGGGLFGSAEMTGSIGVVTINMARLGYIHKGDLKGLKEDLGHILEVAKDTLESKRKAIIDLYNRGLYPYTKRYLKNFNNHFSTIGINGMNEMLLNFTNRRLDISMDEGRELAMEILEVVRDYLKIFQEDTGNLYNLEATPAEGTTYRFAKEDKKRYKDIIQAGEGEQVYYTNSSQIQAGFTDDPFEALELQDDLQCEYTGGTVLHLYMEERVKDIDTCKKLIKKVLTNFKLPYITITPLFSVCPTDGYLKGEHKICPKCGRKVQTFTRVMGYHRPIDSFNKGKKGEHNERMYFKNKYIR